MATTNARSRRRSSRSSRSTPAAVDAAGAREEREGSKSARNALRAEEHAASTGSGSCSPNGAGAQLKHARWGSVVTTTTGSDNGRHGSPTPFCGHQAREIELPCIPPVGPTSTSLKRGGEPETKSRFRAMQLRFFGLHMREIEVSCSWGPSRPNAIRVKNPWGASSASAEGLFLL